MASFWGKSSKFLGSTPGEVSKFTLFPCEHPHKSRNVQIQAKKSTEQQKCKKMQSKLGNIHKTSGKSKIIHESARLCWQDIVSTPAKVSEHEGWSFWSNLRSAVFGVEKSCIISSPSPHPKKLLKGVIPWKSMWDEIMSTCRFVKFRLWYIYDHLYIDMRSVIDRTYCTYHCSIVKDTHVRRQGNQKNPPWTKKQTS